MLLYDIRINCKSGTESIMSVPSFLRILSLTILLSGNMVAVK